MFMRVFSDDNMPGSTSEYLYVQAIEDAMALGAQSINLSLGAAGGSQYDTTGVLARAIANARAQGVSVVLRLVTKIHSVQVIVAQELRTLITALSAHHQLPAILFR